jgi:formylglycine-generating enzyme required for sulfatase activity
MKLTLIPAGSFLMGATPDDARAHDNEKPQHKVTITRPFYLAVYEVTQYEYKQVMGANPSDFNHSELLPVEGVSWLDAVTFCNKLSEREGRRPYYNIENRTVTILGGYGYRLPTEAEWEYACRAGTTSLWSFSDDIQDAKPSEHMWYQPIGKTLTNVSTHPVGKKKANPFGLFDMHGNVEEMCKDYWVAGYYERSPPEDPAGPGIVAKNPQRVARGGSFQEIPFLCRSASRSPLDPSLGYVQVGFRVVCEIPLPAE